jgi:hypothetical protein
MTRHPSATLGGQPGFRDIEQQTDLGEFHTANPWGLKTIRAFPV